MNPELLQSEHVSKCAGDKTGKCLAACPQWHEQAPPGGFAGVPSPCHHCSDHALAVVGSEPTLAGVLGELLAISALVSGAPLVLWRCGQETLCWFEGKTAPGFPKLEREISFGLEAGPADAFLSVTDLTLDARFCQHPSVKGKPRLRFLARTRLIATDGSEAGVLAVLDYVPRALDSRQKEALERLGRQVASQWEGRRQAQAARATVARHERAEKNARANEHRLRKMVENASGGFLLIDVTGHARFASESITGLMGYEMTEILGRNMFTLIHPEDLPMVLDSFADVLKAPLNKSSSQFRALQKDGSWKWMEAAAQNFLDDPAVQAVSCNLWDVSRAKAVEAALRRSESRFRRIMDSNMVGLFFWNLNGGITEANDRFLEMIGYARADLAANRLNWAAMLPLEHAARDQWGIKQIIETGVCPPFEKEFIRQDGSRIPVLLGAAVDEGCRDSGFCFVVDVTDRKRMERELVRERNLLRTLIDHIPDYIYVKDTQSRYVANNQANLSLMGLASLERTLGKTASDFFPHDLARKFEADDQELFRSGQPLFDREETIVGPGGGKRWLLTTKVPLRDPSGAVTGLVGISRDITERKRHEQILATERNLFRAVLEHLPLCVFAVDEEQKFILNNRTHLRFLGLDDSTVLEGQPFRSAGPTELAATEAGDIESVLQTGQPVFPRQHTVTDAQGGRRIHLASKVPLLDPSGKLRGVIGLSQDITERQQAQEQIEKLAAFPQFAPSPVFELSATGEVTYFNAAAQTLSMLAGKAHPAEIVPPQSLPVVTECLRTGQPKVRLETKLGERTITWSFFPHSASRVVHCYGTDMTERLALEAQLRQSQKMECVGQLAGGVAHDFNNILTVIQGHAALILREPISAELTESAEQIAQASDRAANLTRQLLTFSRRQVLQPRHLDLNGVVCNMAKMLQRVLGEDIALNVRYASNLPPVHADPGMIEQVLINLAVNSRDAMPKGGQLDIQLKAVELGRRAAQTHPEARAGTFVVLTVTDTGCGIPAENVERIFEPFFTTKGVGHGTGLGLATIYGIVKQHQGWIRVESTVHRGTLFEICLPASEKPAALYSPTPRRVRGGSECILLVEDEEPLRELVRCVLESYGYTVLDAATGRLALEVWQQHSERIDLLLTDIVMPDGITGRDLAETVKQQRPELRVLFSSGYSADIIGKDFVLADGVNFLQKPYSPQTLAETVRDCLDR